LEIFYIPGNHDEALKNYFDSSFGNVKLKKGLRARRRRRQALRAAARGSVRPGHHLRALAVDPGRRLVQPARGPESHALLARRKLKLGGHWSLADYAKRNIQGAASFISGFEVAIARHGKALAVDGVICGHIHTPVIKQLDGVSLPQLRRLVDSCTAIVERLDGSMELVRHTAAGDEPGSAPASSPRLPESLA